MMLDKDAILTAEDLLTPPISTGKPMPSFPGHTEPVPPGEPADILTVTEELKRMGRLDDVGGVLYVNELPANVVTTKSVDRHAEIVAGKAKLRRLIDAAPAPLPTKPTPSGRMWRTLRTTRKSPFWK